MKILIAAILLVCSLQAAAVTVDFEDAGGESAPVARDGLLFTSDSSAAAVNPANGTDGYALGCPYGCTFTIQAADSSLFALDSIEVYAGSSVPEYDSIYVYLTGFFSGGSSIEVETSLDLSGPTYDTHTFLPAWNELEKVEVSARVGAPCCSLAGFAIDNVNASVVPIPAAIWLFGSALVGFGWLRRKQTA